MAGHKSRILTLQALVAGMSALAGQPASKAINDEFYEVFRVRKVRISKRRHLLEILHSARALDTALQTFVAHHKCSSPHLRGKPASSLGSCLIALRDHAIPTIGRITNAERSHFNSKIVASRNHYMHQAGAFPANESEVNILLAEMHACLARVASL